MKPQGETKRVRQGVLLSRADEVAEIHGEDRVLHPRPQGDELAVPFAEVLKEIARPEGEHVVKVVFEAGADVDFTQFLTPNASLLNERLSGDRIRRHDARGVIERLHQARGHAHVGIHAADDVASLDGVKAINRLRWHQKLVEIQGERHAVVVVNQGFVGRAQAQVGGNEVSFSRLRVGHLGAQVAHVHPQTENAIGFSPVGTVVHVVHAQVRCHRNARTAVSPLDGRSSGEVAVDETRRKSTAEFVGELLREPAVQAQLRGLKITNGSSHIIREGDVAQAEVAQRHAICLPVVQPSDRTHVGEVHVVHELPQPRCVAQAKLHFVFNEGHLGRIPVQGIGVWRQRDSHVAHGARARVWRNHQEWHRRGDGVQLQQVPRVVWRHLGFRWQSRDKGKKEPEKDTVVHGRQSQS